MSANNTSRTGAASPTPVTTKPAFAAAHRGRIVAIAAVVPVISALAGSALMLSWSSELPDPIAIHWDAGGNPDGYGSVGGNAALIFCIVVVFSGLISAAVSTTRATVLPTKSPQFLVATSVWLGVFLTIGIVGSVAVQRGLDDAAAAGSPVTSMIVGAVIATALAAGAWFGVPRAALLDDTTLPAITALELATHERVQFSETLRPSRGSIYLLVLLPVAVVVALAVFGVTGTIGGTEAVLQPWWPVAIGVVVLGIEAACLVWRVRIDSRGLLVRSILGFPRFRLPLEEIVEVRVVEVRPLAEFGGWGIRIAGKRTGIIVRAGSAVQVSRSNGKILVFSTADGDRATALLAGLLTRRDAVAGV